MAQHLVLRSESGRQLRAGALAISAIALCCVLVAVVPRKGRTSDSVEVSQQEGGGSAAPRAGSECAALYVLCSIRVDSAFLILLVQKVGAAEHRCDYILMVHLLCSSPTTCSGALAAGGRTLSHQAPLSLQGPRRVNLAL
jgi:hypothetical protein